MPTDPFFHLRVEGSFSISGRGTVATGTIDKGTLRPGDQLAVKGREHKPMTVTSIEVGGKVVDEANGGDKVGILLGGVTRDWVQLGDELISPDAGYS